jgi:glycosyltransferase involved in cell wall biosynthesis
VGGIPEFIKEQKTGLLVKPGDPEVLADAIEYLFDNDCERRRLGAEGRRAVEDSFSMELHAQNLMKIYEEIEHSDY